MRKSFPQYLSPFLIALSLSGCGGNNADLLDTAAFRANCQVCHALDGSPTPLGPQNIQLGPNTCQLVDCSDVAALTTYIENYMPPQPENCVAECAQETAELIASDFQPSSESAARIVMENLEEILNNAEVHAYNPVTGDSIKLEATPADK